MKKPFSAKDIYNEMRQKRELMPIQHTGKNDCICSLCIYDREQALIKREKATALPSRATHDDKAPFSHETDTKEEQ